MGACLGKKKATSEIEAARRARIHSGNEKSPPVRKDWRASIWDLVAETKKPGSGLGCRALLKNNKAELTPGFAALRIRVAAEVVNVTAFERLRLVQDICGIEKQKAELTPGFAALCVYARCWVLF